MVTPQPPFPSAIVTREQQEQVLRIAVAAADKTHGRPPGPIGPEWARHYASECVAKPMRRMSLANQERIQYPLADILSFAAKIDDGEFDAFFVEVFSQ